MFRLLEPASLCVEIKKSRFIARCLPISSPEMAASEIEKCRVPDATHNCWAWRLGDLYRFSDDGEPGGSAGRPILAAIDGQQYDGVLAHVVRWFGGIKLGVGGLVRAYGNTVAQALREANKEIIVSMDALSFLSPFADTYAVYGIIHQRKLMKISESYTPEGVCFEVSVRSDEKRQIIEQFNNATGARIRWFGEQT